MEVDQDQDQDQDQDRDRDQDQDQDQEEAIWLLPNGMPNVEQLSKSTMEPNVYIATYQNIGISMIENAKTVLPTLTLMLMLVNVSLVSLAKLTAIKYINVLMLDDYDLYDRVYLVNKIFIKNIFIII